MSNGSSEWHQNNNLKAIITNANYLGSSVTFTSINTSHKVLSFLDTKIKTKEEEPDQKWITTWNDYLHRIMHFLRWLHNKNSSSSSGCLSMENWKTPIFLQIKEKRTKRVSPYLESELCDAMSNTFFNNILWLSVVCLHINSSQVNAASRVQAYIRCLNGWIMA